MIIAARKAPTFTLTSSPSGFFWDKARQHGWRLVENAPLEPGNLVLELADYGDEPYVMGDDFLERARKMTHRAGQFHADRLLCHRYLIPQAWEEFEPVFAGTVWEGSGDLWMPIMEFHKKDKNNPDRDGWQFNIRCVREAFNCKRKIVRVAGLEAA